MIVKAVKALLAGQHRENQSIHSINPSNNILYATGLSSGIVGLVATDPERDRNASSRLCCELERDTTLVYLNKLSIT